MGLEPDTTDKMKGRLDSISIGSPFDALDYNPQEDVVGFGKGDFCFKARESGEISVYNPFFVDFDLPNKEIDRVKWVMNSVNEGAKDLSGNDPSLLYVHLPVSHINKMAEKSVIDHRGNEVTELERLQQRINGKLAQSRSINGIVLSGQERTPGGDVSNLARGFRAYPNFDPRTPLSEEMSGFVRLSKEKSE